MRVLTGLLAIALLGVCATADDRSSCEQKCEEKYDDADEKACLTGCEHRGSLSNGGPLAFINCHRFCDTGFTNKTTEKGACHFACSLPMHSSVVMTLVNDGGKQKWKMIRQDGDDEPVVSMQESSPLGDILLGKMRGKGEDQPLALRAPSSDSSEDSSDEDREDFMMDFARMQHRMRLMMESLQKDLLANLREKQQVAVARPAGHDPWGNGGRIVGNQGEDGLPMILTKPVALEHIDNDDDEDERRGFVVEFRQSEKRSQFLVIFHWLLVAVGIAALLTTIMAICLFLRSIRNNSYRRMGHDSATMPVFARVQPSPLPVKKVPEEGWMDNHPSGVPPPAYDQVSIHASPKLPDSDKSTSEAETPSPTNH